MTPPLLEADRAWFAALNAARRARTPRTRPRSSTPSRTTSADRPKLVISFGEAHLALPRSCTGRDRAFSGTKHEAVTSEQLLAVALALKPGKPYRPLVPPASHPTKWRTTTTIPAHAPRLNATADQRMIMECQSISFMAPP